MKRAETQVKKIEDSSLPDELTFPFPAKELLARIHSLNGTTKGVKENINGILRHVGLKGLVQKVRICDGTSENKIRIGIFVSLGLLIVLAALATYRLHRISDFKELFRKSATVGLCKEYPKLQAAHKSLIHDAIKEGDEKFLAEVLEALNKKYNLGAYLKTEDRGERNICTGE